MYEGFNYSGGDSHFDEGDFLLKSDGHASDEAETSDIFLDRIKGYQSYDLAVIVELMSDGFNEFEAIAIAATTMDGAGEQSGGVSSRQTGCPFLRYGENITETEAVAEGREHMHGLLRKFFSLPDTFVLTDEEVDILVDSWITAELFYRQRVELDNSA